MYSKPETGLHSWIEQDQRAQAVSTQRIEQAYADLKAQLIEEARIRKQQALEQITGRQTRSSGSLCGKPQKR